MRALLICSAVLMSAACTPAAAPASESPSAMVEPEPEAPRAPEKPLIRDVPPLSESDYVMTPVSELGLTGSEDPAGIGALLKAKFGANEPVEGNYSEGLSVGEEGGRATIVFAVSGAMDDSVKSTQHVVEVFQPAAVAAGVTGYGVRYQCYRAANPEAWTNQPCS